MRNEAASSGGVRHVLPGLLLAGGLAWLATLLADWIGVDLLGFSSTPVSAILVVVLLGLLIRNTAGLAAVFEPGLRLSMKRLLPIGVALLGIRLSLLAVASIGLVALPIVAMCIGSALFLVAWLSRLLRLPARLGILIAAGTSICGITAIVATAPAIEADDDEVSYAVATITLFGMATLFTYPFLARLLFDSAGQAGLFLGTSIHDTSQVVGAALAYQAQFSAPEALDTAVVTKLTRNLFLIAVIPFLGWRYGRTAVAGSGSAEDERVTRRAVPIFVLGFLAMALLRTAGDVGDRPFGLIEAATWTRAVAATQWTAELLLLLAMAAVGLGTSLRRLRALGTRPLGVGLAAALAVGAVSLVLIRLLAGAGAL